MNVVETYDSGSLADRHDGVDRLLSEHFRSEIPQPWPVMSPPASAMLDPRGDRSSRWRTYASLAASILLLLLATAALVRYQEPRDTASTSGVSGRWEATRRPLHGTVQPAPPAGTVPR